MAAKKRYFPKKFSVPRTRIHRDKTLKPNLSISRSKNNGKNLRHEFDILLREKHTIISDEQLDRLWKQISTQLLQAPNLTLKELISTLENIS